MVSVPVTIADWVKPTSSWKIDRGVNCGSELSDNPEYFIGSNPISSKKAGYSQVVRQRR